MSEMKPKTKLPRVDRVSAEVPPAQTLWQETATGTAFRVDQTARPTRWELPGTLSIREWKRRAWHMSPGLIPIATYIYPHKDPLSPTFQAIAFGVMGLVTSALLWRYQTIKRSESDLPMSAVFGYAWSVVLMFVLFPAHAELGMLVLAVLAFGDGMATTCGLLFRGPSLPWNRGKTWSGFLAFIGFGGGLSSLAYVMEAQPAIHWLPALLCGFAAATVAAMAESIPSRINDNVRVGFAASVTAVVVHAAVVGL